MEKIKLEIPRIPNDPNPINLTLESGDQLFIVGPNGSGKSALIQWFVSKYSQNRIKRITAHRQTWFNSGSIDLTPANRQQHERQNLNYDRSYEARWKDLNPGWNLSAVLFDLVAKDNARARAIAHYIDNHDSKKAQEVSDESPSPFDQINELLSRATLTVTIENLNDRDLMARHPKGQSFNIAEMSDAERSAMIIASHVITADPGTLLLIDEPEKHLHRSIIEPFLSALFNLRKDDCAFVIATHEITLPVANPDARVLILRSCQWSGSECVAWDTEVIKPNPELPEELRRAILGSRNRILFVEGNSNSSLDFPLYTTLFPSLSMIPKGSCEDVQKAVLGLRGSLDIHDVEAFGLIDEDGRPEKDVERLAESGIFALEVYSAESLYYCSDAIAAVAYEQARLRGEDGSEFIESAKQGAIEVIEKHAERMVARRCERRTRELLLSKIPDWKSLKANPSQKICVSADSPYLEELDHFNKLVENRELDRLVARYPARESPAFETIARSLKCLNKMDYERMVVARIRQDSELVKKLKKRIGPLSEALDQSGSLAIP